MPSFWNVLPLYLATLFGILVLLRDVRVGSSCLLVFADWWVCTKWQAPISGWQRAMLVDGLTAYGLSRLGGRGNAFLVATYVVELLMHCGYGLAEQARGGYSLTADQAYYWSTFTVAWIQAVFLSLWGSTDGGTPKRVRRLGPCLGLPSRWVRGISRAFRQAD